MRNITIYPVDTKEIARTYPIKDKGRNVAGELDPLTGIFKTVSPKDEHKKTKRISKNRN